MQKKNGSIGKEAIFQIGKLGFTLILINIFMVSNIGFAEVKEIETHCDIFECYTILETDFVIDSKLIDKKYDVDLIEKKALNPTLQADFNIPKYTKGIEGMEIELIDDRTIIIRGQIEGASNNYWGLSIFGDESFINSTWWNSSYDSCMDVYLTKGVDEVLTNFPYFVNITVPEIVGNLTGTFGNMTGIQYVNTDCDKNGYKIPFEIERNDTSTFAETWVRVNMTEAYEDVNISIYYNNNTEVSDSEEPEAVWDSNFVMVQHLEELGSDPDWFDSTSNNNDGLEDNDVDSTVSNLIGRAGEWDGVNSSIDIDDSASLDINYITLETWVEFDYMDSNDVLIDKSEASANNEYRLMVQQSAGTGWVRYCLGLTANGWKCYNGDEDLFATTLHYIVGTYDGTDMNLYVNGVFDETDTYAGDTIDGNTYQVILGRMKATGNQPYYGDMDEVRISDVARSDDWINQTYLMIINQADYVDFGVEEAGVTTSTTTTTVGTTTLTLAEIIDYSCIGNRLVRNWTYWNESEYVSVFNATVCEYNCTETIFGTRCNYSPFINNNILYLAGLFALILIYLLWRVISRMV